MIEVGVGTFKERADAYLQLAQNGEQVVVILTSGDEIALTPVKQKHDV